MRISRRKEISQMSRALLLLVQLAGQWTNKVKFEEEVGGSMIVIVIVIVIAEVHILVAVGEGVILESEILAL